MFPAECSGIHNKISEITQSLMHENRWSGNETEFTTWWNGKVLFLKWKISGLFIHKPFQLPGTIYSLGRCHFLRTKLLKHISLHCLTRYPFTPGSREGTWRQSVLPRSTTSRHNSAQSGIEPCSLARKSCMLPLKHAAPHYLLHINTNRGQPVSDLWTQIPGSLHDCM